MALMVYVPANSNIEIFFWDQTNIIWLLLAMDISSGFLEEHVINPRILFSVYISSWSLSNRYSENE